MGSLFSKGTKKHSSNRISNSNEIEPVEHLDSVNDLEEIRVPDKTSKNKVKSISLFSPFAKKSFIRKTSSLQAATTTQNVPNNPLEKLRLENAELKKEMQRITEKNLEEHQHLNIELNRLKALNKGLNSAVRKLRADKEKALITEKDAVERANNLELGKFLLSIIFFIAIFRLFAVVLKVFTSLDFFRFLV
jgi:ABC-type phosphate transport system, auxiliary component